MNFSRGNKDSIEYITKCKTFLLYLYSVYPVSPRWNYDVDRKAVQQQGPSGSARPGTRTLH